MAVACGYYVLTKVQPQSLQELVDWYGTRAAHDDRLDWAVVDRGTEGIVGEVVLNQWDAGNRCVNFRTLLGPPAQGGGLGTEAAHLALDHAFVVAGVHRVALEVLCLQSPSASRL